MSVLIPMCWAFPETLTWLLKLRVHMLIVELTSDEIACDTMVTGIGRRPMVSRVALGCYKLHLLQSVGQLGTVGLTLNISIAPDIPFVSGATR